MAAIIAQMSLRNRERKKRRAALGRRGETGSDKCVYTLPPFDQCYDPLLHNKYVRAKRFPNLLLLVNLMVIRHANNGIDCNLQVCKSKTISSIKLKR